jgi:hypothetical protein
MMGFTTGSCRTSAARPRMCYRAQGARRAWLAKATEALRRHSTHTTRPPPPHVHNSVLVRGHVGVGGGTPLLLPLPLRGWVVLYILLRRAKRLSSDITLPLGGSSGGRRRARTWNQIEDSRLNCFCVSAIGAAGAGVSFSIKGTETPSGVRG